MFTTFVATLLGGFIGVMIGEFTAPYIFKRNKGDKE